MAKLVDILIESKLSDFLQKAKSTIKNASLKLSKWLEGDKAMDEDDENVFKAIEDKSEEAWKIYNKSPESQDADIDDETGELSFTPGSNYARIRSISDILDEFLELMEKTKTGDQERVNGRKKILNKLSQIKM